jgi:hypothetical protein
MVLRDVDSPTKEMIRLSFMQKVGDPSLEAFRLERRQESTLSILGNSFVSSFTLQWFCTRMLSMTLMGCSDPDFLLHIFDSTLPHNEYTS